MNRFEEFKRKCEAEGTDRHYAGLMPENVYDDVLELLRGFEVIEHSPQEEDWCHLCDSDFGLEVKNPHPGGVPLLIDLAGNFSVFFGEWHAHYDACLDDYEDWFRPAVKNLLTNARCTLWLADANGEWMESILSESALRRDCSLDAALRECDIHEEMHERLDKLGGLIKVSYFDPSLSFEIPIPPANKVRQ